MNSNIRGSPHIGPIQNPGWGMLPVVLRPVLSHLSQEKAPQSPLDLASQGAAQLPLGF